MPIPVSIPARMEYIQHLFMEVERVVEKLSEPDEIYLYLDAEAPLFRSVGYESASMVLGVRDLMHHKSLDRWLDFRNQCAGQHTFHMDIGLGWAFAKSGVWPSAYEHSLDPAIQWMVYDGIGYYYGLFKGRTTLKQGLVPPELTEKQAEGFDEGLGRRLWYMAKGNVAELLPLIRHFDEARHAALWQGVGIANGYVGGNQEATIAALMEASGEYQEYFAMGILLATVSRLASSSIDREVENTLRQVCNMELAALSNAHVHSLNHFNKMNDANPGPGFPLREIYNFMNLPENENVIP